MYHDVYNSEVSESGFQNIGAINYKISRQSFDIQISELSYLCKNKKMENKNVCLTFDDGGISFLTVIAPILEKYGFTGYFFITTKLINSVGFLTSDDILELDRRGHIIGTHSHSHPKNISALSDSEIELEWVKSINILEDILKKPIEYASIPGGFYSRVSAKILFSIGIKAIFTSNPSTVVKLVGTKMIIGRYSVTQDMTTKDVTEILNPYSLIRLEKTIKWNMLKLLKLILGEYYFILRNNLIRTKKTEE